MGVSVRTMRLKIGMLEIRGQLVHDSRHIFQFYWHSTSVFCMLPENWLVQHIPEPLNWAEEDDMMQEGAFPAKSLLPVLATTFVIIRGCCSAGSRKSVGSSNGAKAGL